MSFDRVVETAAPVNASAPFALAGAVLGYRVFGGVYSAGGGVPVYYGAEGLDATGNLNGQWEIGTGAYVAGNLLQRTPEVSSSGTGVGCDFSSSTSVRVFDGVSVAAVAAKIAAAILAHANATSGVHGISAFGASINAAANDAAVRSLLSLAAIATSGSATDLTAGTLDAARLPAFTGDVTTSAGSSATTIATGAVSSAKMGGDVGAAGKSMVTAADAAAQRALLSLDTLFLCLDGTNQMAATLVINKTAPSVSAPTITTPAAVDLWISAASGAASRGIFISSSTASSGGDGLILYGSSASLAGRTSVVVSTAVTAVPDRYCFRVDATGAAAVFRVAGGGQAHHGSGTDAAPGVSFLTDTASGIRLPATSELSAVIAGVERWRITGTNFTNQNKLTQIGDFATPAITPAQITATTADYTTGNGVFFRLSTDASRTLSGIAGGADGKLLLISNVGSFPLVLAHENVGSTAANRINSVTGADVTVSAGGTAKLIYDATALRWRVISVFVDAATQRTALGLGTLATQSGTFSGTSSGTNTGDQSVFSTIAVPAQASVVASAPGQTLNLVAGTNVSIATNNTTKTITISATGGGGGSGPESLFVTVDFGASFTDKASVVVTGLAWVTATSKIQAFLAEPGVDPDELRLLRLEPIVSDLVVGVGFTLTVYSEPEARGTYTFSILGVA